MIGSFVKEYLFETEDDRLKIISQIQETAKNLQLSDVISFDFSTDMVQHELLYNELCQLDHLAPCEYWHLKSASSSINSKNLNSTRLMSEYHRIE